MSLGYHRRLELRDHALKNRKLFLRPSLWARVRKWMRRNSFGIL